MTTPKLNTVETTERLAKAVLVMAADGGMPDTFWAQDSRIELACEVLAWTPEKAREWARAAHEAKVKRKWTDTEERR